VAKLLALFKVPFRFTSHVPAKVLDEDADTIRSTHSGKPIRIHSIVPTLTAAGLQPFLL
jgi:hypothetical protein